MAVAAAQAPPTAGPDARDDLTTGDEVKEYFHEGEGENEHFNSMDLHDIKTELEKDAEAAEMVSHFLAASGPDGQTRYVCSYFTAFCIEHACCVLCVYKLPAEERNQRARGGVSEG